MFATPQNLEDSDSDSDSDQGPKVPDPKESMSGLLSQTKKSSKFAKKHHHSSDSQQSVTA
jgi:hypothetical protein